MSTKSCPFCNKEISDEAIICKFCHRLLIDENGKDILPGEENAAPAAAAAATAAVEDPEDKTRVFSKDELRRAASNPSPKAEQEEYDETPVEEYYEEEEYYDDADGAPAPLTDEEFYQEFGFRRGASGSASDEYDPKRTFIITAFITVGIVLVIVGAIFVGSKLFGMNDDKETSSKLTASTPAKDGSEKADGDQQGEPTEPTDPDGSTYLPDVTDDTLSEDPEIITDGSLTDPAGDSSITISLPDSIDPSSRTDSAANDDSSASDPDTSVPDDTSSVGDAPADGEQPSFGAAGEYYSWGEAEQLMSEYAAANGIYDYSYYDGTDGVEMLYVSYDEAGNAYIYRVDLVTGYVSPYY